MKAPVAVCVIDIHSNIPSVRLAVLVGEPSQPGPYVIRVKAPMGVKLMPRKRPEDRIYTVMSGVCSIGLGDRFEAENLKAHPPGSVVVLPGDRVAFPLGKVGRVRHADSRRRSVRPRIHGGSR